VSQVPPPTPPASPHDWPPGQPATVYGVAVPSRTSAAAVASLVLGILGCVPLLTGVLAILFGAAGIRATRDPRFRGRGLAIAGLVLGIVSFVAWSLFGGMLGLGYVRSKPARAVAHQFTADLAAGDVPAAQSRCTSNVTRPSLDAAANAMRSWGALSDMTTSRFNYGAHTGGETCVLDGVATFANARANFSFRLVKQGAVFRVDAFSFVDQKGLPAGTVPSAPATEGG